MEDVDLNENEIEKLIDITNDEIKKFGNNETDENNLNELSENISINSEEEKEDDSNENKELEDNN
jgi:hypothetical protein